MPIKYSTDIIPISEARSRLPELLDEVRAGETKIITRNGHAWAALIDVEQLEYFQQLDLRKQRDDDLTQLQSGLEDAVNARTVDEKTFRTSLKRRIARLERKK